MIVGICYADGLLLFTNVEDILHDYKISSIDLQKIFKDRSIIHRGTSRNQENSSFKHILSKGLLKVNFKDITRD